MRSSSPIVVRSVDAGASALRARAGTASSATTARIVRMESSFPVKPVSLPSNAGSSDLLRGRAGRSIGGAVTRRLGGKESRLGLVIGRQGRQLKLFLPPVGSGGES